MRRLLLLLAGWGLVAPASALAVGGPVMPVQGGSGVTMPGLPTRFVAIAHGRDTQVDMLRGGAVQATRRLSGRLGIPGVGIDGSTTGLSADGRTLVVAGKPSPERTRLIVLSAERLRGPARELSLPGYFTVDALSPDGARIYLVHYLAPSQDLLRYEVRAYDVASARLVGGPIVDPRQPDEKMQGFAVTRTTSRDGRWAYTLYAGDESFVHALDTVGGKAFCIDLPAGDVTSATLRLDGGKLHVGALATVDLHTLKASAGDAPAAAGRPPADERGSDALLWVALGIAAVAALAFATRLGRRRSAGSRPRSTPAP